MSDAMMIDLSEIMRGSGDAAYQQAVKKAGPEPCVEARLMELEAAGARYDSPCPFKVGDVVTPRVNSALRHSGKPHRVVEVYAEPHRSWNGEASLPQFGARYDMRVMAMNDFHQIIVWSAESWVYEKWSPEMENDPARNVLK